MRLSSINDGSPDDSAEIVRGCRPEFPNILLLNQANQGVSVARNNGVAQAAENTLWQ
jgi:glycosyltransferase involved in cell wall biosynthesis